MRTVRFAALALVVSGVFVLLPSPAAAQSAISGVVSDNTGAVLPGVTIEASSPVLIGRVRTAVTDGTGQYRIIELPPGPYEITFTARGFIVVKREGVEVTGSARFLSTSRCASGPPRRSSP